MVGNSINSIIVNTQNWIIFQDSIYHVQLSSNAKCCLSELIDGDSEDFEEMGILTDSSTEGEEYMAGIASAEEEVALSESEEDEVPISVSEDEETATTFMSEDEDMRTCVSESSCTDDDVISFMWKYFRILHSVIASFELQIGLKLSNYTKIQHAAPNTKHLSAIL